jgi:hypothetical protein
MVPNPTLDNAFGGRFQRSFMASDVFNASGRHGFVALRKGESLRHFAHWERRTASPGGPSECLGACTLGSRLLRNNWRGPEGVREDEVGASPAPPTFDQVRNVRQDTACPHSPIALPSS